MNDSELPILPGERRVRFVCGAVAGIAIGSGIMFSRSGSVGGTILVCVGLAAVLGLAAALFGDQFWRWLNDVTGWVRW